MKSIVLAGGCFWGVQNYFNQVKGVIKTRVGYTAGFIDFPTYNQVCSGKSGHTEACIVHYDSSNTNLSIILEHFFNIVDPTLIDQQGNDVGSQYRSGIYYYYKEDFDEIMKYINKIKDNYSSKIVTEVMECDDFWEAEEYHQNYLEKNPGGYCHIDTGKYYCSIMIDYGKERAANVNLDKRNESLTENERPQEIIYKNENNISNKEFKFDKDDSNDDVESEENFESFDEIENEEKGNQTNNVKFEKTPNDIEENKQESNDLLNHVNYNQIEEMVQDK